MKQPFSSATNGWPSNQLESKISRWLLTALMSLAVVAGLVAVTINTVSAQEPSLDDQLQDLARTYRGQLVEYAEAEKQYQLAVSQYQQLNTLTSLEQAVSATRQAVLIRDLVLITYLQQVRLHLIQTQGIEVGVKARTTDRLEKMIEAVQLHYSVTEAANDRLALQEVTDAFQVLVPEYYNLTVFSVGMIELGRIQNVHDQTKAVLSFISSADDSHLTRLQRDQRQRSIDETTRFTQQLDEQLELQLAKWMEKEVTDQKLETGDLQQSLERLYGTVAQLQEFLKELARLTDGVSI